MLSARIHTEIRFYGVDGIELHVVVLFEHVLIDSTATKKPDVTIIGDGAMCLVRHVKVGTLGLGFHRRHQVWNTEQLQKLLIHTAVHQPLSVTFTELSDLEQNKT